MVDATLAREFPWLRSDPEPIMGDSRPRTIQQLIAKGPLWRQLYREWLSAEHSDYTAGLQTLESDQSKLAAYMQSFGREYDAFYRAAGELKDLLRRNPAAVPQRFPWAPPDPKQPLGEARPGDFRALLRAGTRSTWYQVFRAFLGSSPPFEGAPSWLDWVAGGGDKPWHDRLEATMPAFADEIGRLKDRIRAGRGDVFERTAQRIDSTATRIVDSAQRGVEDVTHALRERTGFAPRTGPPPSQTPPRQTTTPQTTPPQTTSSQWTTARPQGEQPPPGPPRASAAYQDLRQQVDLAMPIVNGAPKVVGRISALAERFGAFGGIVGDEAANLTAFKAVVEQDVAWLTESVQAAAAQPQSGDDATLYGALAALRSSVYRLAWNVDLGYEQYYGGWPHQRIAWAQQTLTAAGSREVCFYACRPLQDLVGEILPLYDAIAEWLAPMLALVRTRPPRYTVEDGAVPWGRPEIARAEAELIVLDQVISSWTESQAFDQDDEARLDQVANEALGLPFERILALAR